MKKLLVLLFSILLLSSPSVFADDISDFQIEGISIGDSLLDYMTEEEILTEIEETKDLYSHLNEPNKYAEVYLSDTSSIYTGGLSFFVKHNPTSKYITNKNRNEKYIILSVRGMIDYIEDFDGCIVKRDEIIEELSMMFPNTQKTEHFLKHSADPSGNSIDDEVNFEFDSGGYISLSCDNFEETLRIKKNWTEGLGVSISSIEMINWLSDY
jgi:hypothetical protein